MMDIAYIWIDALCIIQDDEEDKEKEIKNMGHIYRNAFLNVGGIAAAEAIPMSQNNNGSDSGEETGVETGDDVCTDTTSDDGSTESLDSASSDESDSGSDDELSDESDEISNNASESK